MNPCQLSDRSFDSDIFFGLYIDNQFIVNNAKTMILFTLDYLHGGYHGHIFIRRTKLSHVIFNFLTLARTSLPRPKQV